MQWHPVFAHLLRALVEDYFDVQTDWPVGDLPRQADILLLRRTSAGPTPFQGMWRFLSHWNVIEFKGPTEDARLQDPDLLIEVGLGVERRLNEEQERLGQPRRQREEMSYWYIAHAIGSRFRARVERLMGQPLEPLAEGLWRVPCLERWFYVVGSSQLTVDRDSVPLHLVTREPIEQERELAQQVAAQPNLWKAYGPWLALFHQNLWQEVIRMASATGNIWDEVDFNRFLERVGPQNFFKQVGIKPFVEAFGIKRAIEEMGLHAVIAEVGTDEIFDALTEQQREALKRRLQ